MNKLTSIFTLGVLAAGCASTTVDPADDPQDLPATATGALTYGNSSDAAVYAGKRVTYHFNAKAGDLIDLNVVTVLGDTNAPSAVELTTLGDEILTAGDTTTTRGTVASEANVNITKLLPRTGTYRISYTGDTGSSYYVDLFGWTPCDSDAGPRNNPACPADVCIPAGSLYLGVTAFCTPTIAGGGICDTGADACADGFTCEYDEGTAQGDTGGDGLCEASS